MTGSTVTLPFDEYVQAIVDIQRLAKESVEDGERHDARQSDLATRRDACREIIDDVERRVRGLVEAVPPSSASAPRTTDAAGQWEELAHRATERARLTQERIEMLSVSEQLWDGLETALGAGSTYGPFREWKEEVTKGWAGIEQRLASSEIVDVRAGVDAMRNARQVYVDLRNALESAMKAAKGEVATNDEAIHTAEQHLVDLDGRLRSSEESAMKKCMTMAAQFAAFGAMSGGCYGACAKATEFTPSAFAGAMVLASLGGLIGYLSGRDNDHSDTLRARRVAWRELALLRNEPMQLDAEHDRLRRELEPLPKF